MNTKLFTRHLTDLGLLNGLLLRANGRTVNSRVTLLSQGPIGLVNVTHQSFATATEIAHSYENKAKTNSSIFLHPYAMYA